VGRLRTCQEDANNPQRMLSTALYVPQEPILLPCIRKLRTYKLLKQRWCGHCRRR
jgi:hypothetical protein